VHRVMKQLLIVPNAVQKNIREIRGFCQLSGVKQEFLVITSQDGSFAGALAASEIFRPDADPETPVSSIAKRDIYTIPESNHLDKAAELLAKSTSPFLIVTSDTLREEMKGIITYKEILGCYLRHARDNRESRRGMLPGRQRLRILVKGRLPRTSDY